jgi:hypothetical protein
MGSVHYPIDIVFADASGRIGRIVHDAQPGSRSRWSHPVCGAVVELQGGQCALSGIETGQRVRVAASREAASSYNLLRTLVEADGDPLMEGYYSREPLETRTPVQNVPPHERFRDHRLPDEAFPEAMDQPQEGWREQFGYQPTEGLEDQVGPNVRMSQIADEGEFVASLVEAMARKQAGGQAALPWAPDALNQGATESAIVTPRVIQSWVNMLGLTPAGGDEVIAAAASPSGMQVLGDGLVLAGLADQARMEQGYLVLHRGRRNHG